MSLVFPQLAIVPMTGLQTKSVTKTLENVCVCLDSLETSVKLVSNGVLSSEFWARQAQSKVVKIKNLDFSYWAWSTPWGHVLSLKKFCQNPALSWAISYSVFQPVKFTNSFEFVCGTLFSTFWRLILKFGYIKWF